MAMGTPRLVFSNRARVGNLPGGTSDLPATLPWLVAAHAGLGVIGVGCTWAFGLDPFTTDAWLGTSGVEAFVGSLTLGFTSAVLVIMLSRTLSRRTQWARALHDEQRPFVSAQSDLALFAMAIGSGVCEELFFRSFLGRTVGIVLAAIAFGVLHQVRGIGRWGWMLTAAGLGVWLSLLFKMTGQLVGPIVAHVIINAANLRHLRDHRVTVKVRKLGGLLASTTRDAL